MNYIKMVQFVEKYLMCPDCGNTNVGNGQGELVVDKTFYRSCICGWSVELKEDDTEVVKEEVI